MKYVFIALAYFTFGFAFPNFSPFVAIVLGAVMLFVTLLVIFNLFDDQLESVYFEE